MGFRPWGPPTLYAQVPRLTYPSVQDDKVPTHFPAYHDLGGLLEVSTDLIDILSRPSLFPVLVVYSYLFFFFFSSVHPCHTHALTRRALYFSICACIICSRTHGKNDFMVAAASFNDCIMANFMIQYI